MKTGKIPAYQRIADDIRRKIEEGFYAADAPLPTQLEFAEIYGTSEITSRRALSELARQGWLYRVRGKGTFVRGGGSPVGAAPPKPALLKHICLVSFHMPLSMFNHPFYIELLEGVEETCRERGVDFRVLDMGEGESIPENSGESGYILLPYSNMSPDRLLPWLERGLRMVTVHFYYPQLQIPYVIVDNVTGAFLVTQHMLAQGHRRVGIILTGNSFLDMNQEFSLRLQGYRLALSQHNIPFDPQLVAIVAAQEELPEAGHEGARQLLGLEHPPTAIFATSDYKAAGAVRAAREAGLRVPEDISIAGYDDVAVGPFLKPSLTTVNQNTSQVGKRAAELLLSEWETAGKGSLLKDEIVPRLIIRESTGARTE